MPRKTIDDYTFYKIVDKNGILDLCYVGSSVNMKKRKDAHKTACKNPNNNSKIYKTIRENGGFDEFRFVEIGFREQLTLTQSHIVEDEYRVLLKAELNTYRCYRTPEQLKADQTLATKKYYKNHKEEANEYNKNYYEDNKEDINKKKIVKHICPCGGKYTHQNKAIHEKTNIHQAYIASQDV